MTETPTIRDALRAARDRLAPVSDSAALDVQVLLMHVLNAERAYLLAHGDVSLTPEQRGQFAALVDRRAAGEPVAYILGRRAFFDRELRVSSAVLIPRPETELLLEAALDWVGHGMAAVDVGTGSGALAVTLAANRPDLRVYATDISPAALDVARANAADHAAAVTFFEGDLLLPLIAAGLRVDLVMANLPYIARDDLPALDVSRYEPRLALDGGPDGLDLIRRLVDQLPEVAGPGALALLEIGADQGAAALALVETRLRPVEAGIVRDYAGLDRIIRALLR